MNKIKDGGPAFPHSIIYANNESQFEVKQGLSLRDYFAAKALQALIFAINTYELDDYKCVANDAYQMADAMLAERERGE